MRAPMYRSRADPTVLPKRPAPPSNRAHRTDTEKGRVSEMTQLEQAPARAISLSAGIVALAAALVIAVTIVLGMLIPARVSFPATEQDNGHTAPNPALVQAEREWQRQREQQGGYVDPLTQAERNWEQQRKQQSPFDGE